MRTGPYRNPISEALGAVLSLSSHCLKVAAEELVDLGADWVILGHSERRQIIGESNDFVGEKVSYALEQNLKVIACIGETINQRENGQVKSTLNIVPLLAAIL